MNAQTFPRRPLAVATALFISAFLASPAAVAQDTSGNTESPMLEEIIVTAQKREQTLADVPVGYPPSRVRAPGNTWAARRTSVRWQPAFRA